LIHFAGEAFWFANHRTTAATPPRLLPHQRTAFTSADAQTARRVATNVAPDLVIRPALSSQMFDPRGFIE